MSSAQPLSRSASGVRMGDMRAVQDCAAAMIDKDCAYDLAALAGGGQEGATQLINGLNHVGTVASSGDSVQLPPAAKGSIVMVANDGADSMTVYGKEGRTDTINGTAGATGVAQANAKFAVYFCPKDGAWFRVLTA